MRYLKYSFLLAMLLIVQMGIYIFVHRGYSLYSLHGMIWPYVVVLSLLLWNLNRRKEMLSVKDRILACESVVRYASPVFGAWALFYALTNTAPPVAAVTMLLMAMAGNWVIGLIWTLLLVFADYSFFAHAKQPHRE